MAQSVHAATRLTATTPGGRRASYKGSARRGYNASLGSAAVGAGGGFGPGFQAAGSRLYRAEYAAATAAVLAYLVYRWLYQGGLDWPSTVLWIAFPDLVAFVPIGLSARRREWPWWGSYLYDSAHSALPWGLAFGALWLFLGAPYWPLLGWLGHIAADRAAGYGLRSTEGKSDEGR
jgi:hypothetical protein